MILKIQAQCDCGATSEFDLENKNGFGFTTLEVCKECKKVMRFVLSYNPPVKREENEERTDFPTSLKEYIRQYYLQEFNTKINSFIEIPKDFHKDYYELSLNGEHYSVRLETVALRINDMAFHVVMGFDPKLNNIILKSYVNF